jgi:hypothetical protein
MPTCSYSRGAVPVSETRIEELRNAVLRCRLQEEVKATEIWRHDGSNCASAPAVDFKYNQKVSKKVDLFLCRWAFWEGRGGSPCLGPKRRVSGPVMDRADARLAI